ncbi:host specificity protein J (plasmid) [Rhizobium bangladeshense]|uniref:host specificity protein J n=1 Tax=Rhizobium bangladeshense TaxID=1138189 RepID=UPI001A996A4A|nr:phage tail protein [Rhizobium bangladeshense]QSY98661.1 host specificity protein J [Rhizobium bangladeshense]
MGLNRKLALISGNKGGGKGSGSGGKESPNTLRSKATARILDLLGEGEIKGLVNGAKSIYLDETPLMSANGNYNFQGVSWDIRVGLPDQPIMNGAKGVEAITNVGVQVKYGVPITRSLTDPDYDSCKVTIRIPALSIADDKGNIKPTSVSFRIDIRYQGGPWNTSTGEVTLTGKCTSPYDKEYYFALPKNPSGASAPWEIRVTRLSADEDDIKIQKDTYFSSFEGIIEAKFTYPNSAYIGMIIDGEQFNGQIPERKYLVDGRLIKVPSNYTTRLYDVNGNITRNASYSGVWDGTFQQVWSNNPAWVFYDMIINDRFGLGDYIDVSQVDKWGLYEIAKYCDELVPNGFGGTEPRMTFNGVISEKREAYDVLSTMAACFRGMAYWSSGSIVSVQDRPKDPVVLVTPSNVIDGNFERQSSALKSRHTVAIARFQNPNDFYSTDYAVYQDPEGILKYGYRDTKIDAVGCTSRGQAWRMAKWTVLTELYEKTTLTYQAGFDHAGVRPGDIVAVQDPSQAGIEFGGRLAPGCTTTQLNVDIPVTFEIGHAYSMSVVLPNGAVGETDIVISAYDTPTQTITVSPALSVAPDAESQWVITRDDLVPELFRVITIKESAANTYDVMGLQYEPAKFAAVDQDAQFTLLSVSDLPSGDLPKPTLPQFKEYAYALGQVGTIMAVDYSITVPKDPRITQFQWEYQTLIDGVLSDWRRIDQTYDPIVTLTDTQKGTYNFRVRALSALGGTSDWTVSNGIQLLGLTLPPADVDQFRISILGDQSQFIWHVPSLLNIEHFEIRHTPSLTGAIWESAVTIVENAQGTSIQLPTIPGSYLIKSVSFAGTYSPNAAMLINEVKGSELNAVEYIVEQPAFTGTKTNCSVVSGDLMLTETAGIYPPSGTYEFGFVDLSQVYTSRLVATINVFAVDSRDNLDTWESLASVESLANVSSDLWDLSIEYQVTEDDPAGSPAWGPWTEFVTGDLRFRAIRFRVVLYSLEPHVSPAIRKLEINIDMPDRIIADNDVVVPTGGLTVTFDPPFKGLTGLAIADQDMATGDRKLITGKSEAGFTIRYFNSAGTPISRTFDYNAVGYGVRQ